jgi:TonB family protein
MKKHVLIATLAFSAAWAFGQSQPSPTISTEGTEPHRVQVDADTALALVVQKTPIIYPDAARKANIQGRVVLRVVTGYSGDVKEVTIISGDPSLGQSAAATVKQWKYKPYLVEGSPAEMETQVSINFQINVPPPAVTPPLGRFGDDAYSNDFFNIFYPLSRDWVRETDLMRSKIASEGNSQGTYVLLAEVHIPQDTDPLRADSSFVVQAVNRPGASPSEDCSQYLQAVATNLHSQKAGQQKGEVTQFTVAGHDFYRGNFEYSHGVDHGTVLCTSMKDYMVRWHIVGWSKQAIEIAVSTLKSMTPAPPATMVASPTTSPAPQENGISQGTPVKVRVSPGVSTGLLIKKVQPVYPPEARYARIQGSVVMRAVINKAGDVADLEVISGPIELVVSAVNAVRKWKYRPYLLNGEPVAVQTQIVVNYALQL